MAAARPRSSRASTCWPGWESARRHAPGANAVVAGRAIDRRLAGRGAPGAKRRPGADAAADLPGQGEQPRRGRQTARRASPPAPEGMARSNGSRRQSRRWAAASDGRDGRATLQEASWEHWSSELSDTLTRAAIAVLACRVCVGGTVCIGQTASTGTCTPKPSAQVGRSGPKA